MPSADQIDLIDLLGCVALEPGLGGVLFVNLDPRQLPPYAEVLTRAIGALGERLPDPVIVGADTTDELLWPGWGLMAGAERRLTVGPRPGLIRRSSGPVLVVPDLARAGTPVTRAIVTTLGADVVHVERPGVSDHWLAGTRWLTACAGRDLAVLSPHLLDRFPIRVDGAAAPRAVNPEEVSTVDLLGQVNGSHRCRPVLEPEVLDLVLRLDGPHPGVRRHLAIARVARALAERRGAAGVESADVRRACTLVGVTPANEAPPTPPEPQAPVTPPRSTPSAGELAAFEATPPAGEEAGRDADDRAIGDPAAATEVNQTVSLAASDSLHPEDSPDALAEPRVLRWSVTGRTAARRPVGTVVGHERTADLRDLAVVPTLLQTLLRTWSTAQHGAVPAGRPPVTFQDLRRHRRALGAQCALVLVLDHSVRRGWDSSPGLAPHLCWAYDQGATVSVIEFGHAGCLEELRPERYRARSIADPRLVSSLRRTPGTASPLAAALELAGEELHRRMHRGWAAVRSSRLVLVTDGRGNVPLEATAERRVSTLVKRQGIEDALATAHAIARLHRVAVSVIAPVDEQYPTLTADLASALGGKVVYLDDAPGVSQ